ncbi:MAG: PAS domain S-box protein [Myxococcota bacterium]|nr:PAS domain S-box protein [Myxococcota bacterium]
MGARRIDARIAAKSDPPKVKRGRASKKELRRRFNALMEEVQSNRLHFRNVVENNVDGMVVVDADGVIMYMNPAAELLFGRDRDELIGRSFGVPNGGALSEEVNFTKPDGTVGTGELRATATQWEGQRAFLISLRDITERKQGELALKEWSERLEERVQKRTEQLEAVNRELEAFNYTVSHDLRAPLARINGYTTLLKDELGDSCNEECVNYIDRIRAAVGNMVELTDGLLRLSRLTGRKMEIQKVALSDAARHIVEDLRNRYPEREVAVSIAPNLQARADLILLRAALENLIENAWKFTGRCERAEIEVGSTETDGETVFFVRDNGAGFDMTRANELFGAFQRLHEQSDFPGTGVGLTTVQRIIHCHGGRVWAEGEVDKGATFFFTLPK